MRAFVLVGLLALAAPLRADPGVPPKKCVAGPFIFLRSAQPHVDEVKAQVQAILVAEAGNGARHSSTLFPLATPRYGIAALEFMPDALGGIIQARTNCDDHVDMRDAEVVEYMTTLYERLRAERLILIGLQLIDLTKDLQEIPPGEKLEGTKQ